MVIWVALAILLAALAGCGGGAAELTTDEEADLALFNAAVHQTALDGSGYGALIDKLGRAKAIARDKPDAIYVTGQGDRLTIRQLLADAASTLAPYQPDIADDLDRTVATLE